MNNIQTPGGVLHFEAIIIGGSYAGLSAAMALGRSRRKVLVIDSGLPCNRQTPYSHNFITHDGKTPREIAALARQQVEQYPSIQFLSGLATQGIKTEQGFEVRTEAGERFTSKKLLLATGIKDQMPAINGFAECWGISVIHCPYCHGYEVRDQVTAIMDNGDSAMHFAKLVTNLTGSLSIFTNGTATFTAEQRSKLEEHQIPLIETTIDTVRHTQGKMHEVVFTDGTSKPLTALYARLPFRQHSPIAEQLGLNFTEFGHIQTDAFQHTSIPGVFACGDNSVMIRSVPVAVSTGNVAGAMINHQLCEEEF